MLHKHTHKHRYAYIIHIGPQTAFVLFQRCGADFAVFVNTGQEADGSDSGARPDEAVTWGKIKMEAAPVKVSISTFVGLCLKTDKSKMISVCRHTHKHKLCICYNNINKVKLFTQKY